MRNNKKYDIKLPTQDEEKFIQNVLLSTCGVRIVDPETGISEAMKKAEELNYSITPERIEELWTIAKESLRGKGPLPRGRFTYFTSSKRLYR